MTGLLLSLSACAPGSVGALQDQCAGCHPQQAQALSDSSLSRPEPSALFVALREETLQVHGASDAALCEGCHAPAVGHEGGLSCASCHAAVGNLEAQNGALVHDLQGPVRGTSRSDAGPHGSLAGEFFSDSELCGSCHDVDGPAGFQEHPYAAWTQSPAAAQGQGCADCHMPEGDSHSFPGLLGPTDTSLELLAAAVRLEVERQGDQLSLTVFNDNLGHPFPDGASFLRRVSVQLSVQDQLLEQRFLSTRLLNKGAPVFSPNLADEQIVSHVPAGGSRIMRFDAPPRAELCVVFQRLEPGLLLHLGLDPALAGPERRVVCVGA